MFGFTYIQEKDLFKCDSCGAQVERGIVNISSHFASCFGKEAVNSVKKVDASILNTEDKIDVLRNFYNINQ